ncbi:acetamidase/formamidase family protein [Chroogloeocystis siderophila]|jgi:formamidase|uniref:Formamidase n=1 Tax=Chroogloeocystis siderophila 5.2 s.c.1 TaxID=247279 RepID=A0A1U7HRZ3_9CHRO|nr:acetamidase/formamidase family protein [Chroogloeocystis siderophila]OKH26352.1 formamidase [Chroogloeocystis siderophila 5.2 s.c.1]
MSNVTFISRTGFQAKNDPNCFNRLHPALKPVAHAKPGELIVFETRDAFDNQFSPKSTPEQVAFADLNLVHPMTGPVYIEGAERGDVLAVTLVDIEPDEYGYTVIVPGFGFLRDQFSEPFIANWQLDRLSATSEQIPGVKISMCAFPGSIGVLPGEIELEKALAREAQLAQAGGFVLLPNAAGAIPADLFGEQGAHKDKALRTIPPREFGGNMDIKQMQVGTTLLFPCFVEGGGLWCGDVHYAQGDGEVSGTAIEMAARVSVRTEIRKGWGEYVKFPQFEGGIQLQRTEPTKFYATTGIPLKARGELPPHLAYLDSPKAAALENLSEDLTLATRNALLQMIDYLVQQRGYTREQALIIAAVAVDLRIGQLVDVPNYVVSAVLPLNIFGD